MLAQHAHSGVSVSSQIDPDPAHDELSHLMSASVQEYLRGVLDQCKSLARYRGNHAGIQFGGLVEWEDDRRSCYEVSPMLTTTTTTTTTTITITTTENSSGSERGNSNTLIHA